MHKRVILSALVLVVACASETSEPRVDTGEEAVSLLGETLFRPFIPEETLARYEENLALAQADYERDPGNADAIIWLGRRQAYLGRYRDAIATFTEGIEKHPNDPRMYRHRGHRYITVRELDNAISDLATAERLMQGRPIEVEPDGLPNPAGIPTSTLQSNVWYHLALAHYLKGEYAEALPFYEQILSVSSNDDNRAAATDWLYMTLRKLGRTAEADALLTTITPDMNILENHAYHRRLLMYKGLVEPSTLLDPDAGDAVQFATQGYGVGNWYLYNGDEARANEIFRQILDAPNWAAFGFIAAEAELAR